MLQPLRQPVEISSDIFRAMCVRSRNQRDAGFDCRVDDSFGRIGLIADGKTRGIDFQGSSSLFHEHKEGLDLPLVVLVETSMGKVAKDGVEMTDDGTGQFLYSMGQAG